ncbi:GAF domain-containing protein [Aeromicrobium sp.]|uniref:helix-turn-helix domain-containing protein n=1 Tax=Aeromicrobium sp. TaxID=1871063 RepID=UPI001998FE71|nr:GAF domain-containing protein [Aeromicrobium sp.]MBC7631613.1 helix-turn-helix domain-containing protein [Aeromicrobium sp.]
MWIEFLELLARGASIVEYEAPVIEARAAGEPADVVDELENGKQLALQIREMIVAQQRRESELAALYATADDLARVSDVDAVLQAIVHRARQVLHTDIAYLTMNDAEEGDTYMRVTDGATSAKFRQLRLAMGEGLGGLVAQTAMPYATSSYFTDARFNHTKTIDSAVKSEGLVAILGVPLQMRPEVIGVLYAANRFERPFTRAEVALLGSLAAHASAAIDKARLLDETRQALAELSEVNQLLRSHGQAVEKAADAHDRMTELVLRGGGVEDVAVVLVDVVGGSVTVVDEDYRTTASLGDPLDLDSDRIETAVLESRRSRRAVRIEEEGGVLWVAAVVAGQQTLGALVLAGHQDLTEVDQRIVERTALVTALLLLSRRSRAEAETQVRGELLDDLLRSDVGGADLETTVERLRRLGTDLGEPHCVYVVGVAPSGRERTRSAAAHLASTEGGLSGIFDGNVVLVLSGPDAGGRSQRLASDFGKSVGLPVTIGSAGPSVDVGALSATYHEAARCESALRRLGRSGVGAAAADLGFVGLVLGDDPDVPRFVASVVGPIVEYDARRGTDLLGTVHAYFECGGNLKRTRELLHVHVNTVTQRLERISSLIGDDWQAPHRQLEVQLALRLHRITSA